MALVEFWNTAKYLELYVAAQTLTMHSKLLIVLRGSIAPGLKPDNLSCFTEPVCTERSWPQETHRHKSALNQEEPSDGLFERSLRLAIPQASNQTIKSQKLHKKTHPNSVGAHHPQPHIPLFTSRPGMPME